MRTLVAASIVTFTLAGLGSRADAAPCGARLDDHGSVWVNGFQTALTFPIGADWSVPRVALVVYDAGPRTLVSWATIPRDAWAEPTGSPTLWTVTCAGIPTVTQVASIPEADFGHAAVAADSSALMYSSADGVAAVDLASGSSRPIVHEPVCGKVARRDVVVGLEHGELLARRGGRCSKGTWSETPIAIDDPLGRATEHDARPISAFVADAGGALYVAQGDGCAGRRDVIWRSANGGGAWTTIQLPADPDHAVVALFADQKRAGFVLAQMSTCAHDSDRGSGPLLLSRDAGAHWTAVKEDALGMAVVGGSLDHLIVDDAKNTTMNARFETTDAGVTWVQSTSTIDLAARMQPATVAGAKLYPTSDGLVRVEHGTATRVFSTAATLTAPAARTCAIRIDAVRRLWVDGYATGLVVPHDYELERALEPFGIAAGSGEILFSYRSVSRRGRPGGGDTLWRATCGNPPVVTQAYSASDALMGYSVLAADGHTLYFAGQAGVVSVDLATKGAHAVAVTHAPDCIGPVPQRDFPTSLIVDDHHLAFDRGGGCGFESDWEQQSHVLELLAAPPTSSIAGPPRPTTASSVVADAAGTLYATDGYGGCDGSVGLLWKSTDAGDHWTMVKIAYDTPPNRVYADRTRAGHLVVHFSTCASGGRGVWGGWSFATNDGGATWKQINPTHAKPDNSGEDICPYQDLELVDGSTDHLGVRFPKKTLEQSGGTWVPTKREIGPHTGGPVTVGHDVFYPTVVGVLRSRDGVLGFYE